MYQMFGILADIITIDDNQITYIEELPISYFEKNIIDTNKKTLILYLDYGNNYGGKMNLTHTLADSKYVFGLNRIEATDPGNADKSNFLHPIINFSYKDHQEIFHLMENQEAQFNLPFFHLEPLNSFLNHVINFS